MPINPIDPRPVNPPIPPEIPDITEMLKSFEPYVLGLKREGDGIYDFSAFTFASNGCYHADPTAIEVALPPGTDVTIPEYQHVLLHVTYSGGLRRMCTLARKPLFWQGDDIQIGTGKSHIVFHTVLNRTAVLGSSIVPVPTAEEILLAGRYRTRAGGSGISRG
jgi:hypothetical protein